MTIKGRLLLSVPIVKRFRPKIFEVHFFAKICPLGHKRGSVLISTFLIPKGTSLGENASFEPSRVKIRWGVWPVGELKKKKYKYINK